MNALRRVAVFAIPVVLYFAVRPFTNSDAALGALIGAFLVLHALLHLALAIVLPTSTYVVAGRLINWGTLAVGAVLLWTYLRRLRATAAGAAS
jgi:hypothetical protein